VVFGTFVVVFGPVLPARMVHEVSRTEELAEKRRAHSVNHAGLEVEEHRAWYVFAARGLVVKHVDAAKLRVVVAAALAVAADAVLDLARRSSLEVGSTREKKGVEERKNVRNSVWKFGTENMKCRWHARAYPERETKVILPLLRDLGAV